jgi:NADH:ubiquinone oxidoreductase subunit 6 (subunit J)
MFSKKKKKKKKKGSKKKNNQSAAIALAIFALTIIGCITQRASKISPMQSLATAPKPMQHSLPFMAAS